MPNFNKKGGRRRSSSESDGDPLNSTVNPPRIILILILMPQILIDVYLIHILIQRGLLMIPTEIVSVPDLKLGF